MHGVFRKLNGEENPSSWKLITKLYSWHEPSELCVNFSSEDLVLQARFAFNGGNLSFEEFQSRFESNAIQPVWAVALSLHSAEGVIGPSSFLDQLSVGFALDDSAEDGFEILNFPYLFPKNEIEYINSFGILRLLNSGIRGLYI